MANGLVTALLCQNKNRNSAAVVPTKLTFTDLSRLDLGPTLSHYINLPGGSSTVLTTAVITTAAALALTAYFHKTGKDFSRMGDFLFSGFILFDTGRLARDEETTIGWPRSSNRSGVFRWCYTGMQRAISNLGGIVAAYLGGKLTPAEMGYAGLGDSLENRHGAAKLAPRDVRLAGDAAPAGNRGVYWV